jgi:very-short-patch-repair endonuclease
MMQFDERLIEKEHVDKAIKYYMNNRPEHSKARSAFLIHDGIKLPAKFILRLAYKEATGCMPPSETLTGGRASIRVLMDLGFNVLYEKVGGRTNRNPIKNARRSAFKDILEKHFGKVEIEKKFPEICIPDLSNRSAMDAELRLILDKIESLRDMKINIWQTNGKLSFDFFVPGINLVIEFDERQHFTLPRAASLRAYPNNAKLGFDKEKWIRLCEDINAGDNSPAYRDEQRAFYDAIRDIMAPRVGLKPVIRIYESDILWEREGASSLKAKEILLHIKNM